MKNLKNRSVFFVLTIVFVSAMMMPHASSAQISLDGDFRLRTEYRHGFQTLMKEGQDLSFFTSQRSRINLGYNGDRYKVRFSIQDVRTWGNQPSANTTDGLLSLHEAWVEYSMTEKFSLKAGRMELAYDNHRILGNLDWAQQGRKHDLLLLKYTDSTFAIHAGAAFNQDKEQQGTNLYTVPNNYKTMQFVWFNKQWKDLNASWLFLNHGTQYSSTVSLGVLVEYRTKFTQTAGFHADLKKNAFLFNAFAYYQTGRDHKARYVDAYDVSVTATYSFSEKTSMSLGGEQLSGTTQLGDNNINHSFNPFYGTNHIHNGYMDYFYVGNHINSVGLRDIYLRLKQNFWKASLSVDVHQFSSDATVIKKENSQPLDKNLGTEIDLTVRQNVTKELVVQAGYSQMLGTASLAELKSGDHKRNTNWAYIWIIFKPDFMKLKSK